MEASPSEVACTFRSSPEFDSVCDSVFSDLLAQSELPLPRIFLFQLPDASIRLYPLVYSSNPFVERWVHAPPSLADVDRLIRRMRGDSPALDLLETMGPEEFRAFAAELFIEAVADGVRISTRSGKGLVGAALWVCAVGVATAVCLSLLGRNS